MRIAIGLSLLLVTLASDGVASEIGVYFDPQGNTQSRKVSAGESFNFYVLADDVSAGLNAFEFSLRADPRIQIFGRTLRGENAFDVGSGPDNWVVGTGTCQDDSPVVLVEYTALLVTESSGLFLSLEAASPTSSLTQRPAYVPCETTTVLDFEETTGALINPDEQSWGAVKQLYE